MAAPNSSHGTGFLETMEAEEEGGFAPSALGTREHWDAVYERELQAFQECGDSGEIWFGEESMNRLIKWMEKCKIPLDASVLDIGTGNGIFLVELRCWRRWQDKSQGDGSQDPVDDRTPQHLLQPPSWPLE